MYVKKWKIFVIIEKEVEWLNQQSKNGYQLIKRNGFAYYFQEQTSVENQYQIEFIGLNQKLIETENYLNFLSDSGIDIVFKFGPLLYLKRVASNTDFLIYSSSKDIIKQYIKIIKLYALILLFSSSILVKNLTAVGGPYVFNIPIPLATNLILTPMMIYGISVYFANILTIRKNESLN
ncbi:DUF2812 domain-containing protein [Fusibacter bizertensis]